MILILGLHSYYYLPDFDFLRTFAKKLLIKVKNVFKLQFYNIDKLRDKMPKNMSFLMFDTEAVRKLSNHPVHLIDDGGRVDDFVNS